MGVQQGVAYGAMDPFDADTIVTHADAIEVPITNFVFNLKFKNARNGDLPNSATANADNCFTQTGENACLCRPHLDELNAFGYENEAGEQIEFTNDIFNAIDFDNTPTMYHTLCNGSNQNQNQDDPKNDCTSTERAILKSNLVDMVECTAGFQNSLHNKHGGYTGFAYAHSTQALAFDAGLDNTNSQVKTAFNPASNHWEVSVHCNNSPNMATLLKTESQRDFFPSCFFGDELWFTLTYGTGSDATNNDHNLSFNSYASAWFSEVYISGDTEFTQEYLEDEYTSL